MESNGKSDPKSLQVARYVVLSGLVFGAAMGVLLRVTTGSWYYGFHGGFFGGLAFGWAIKRFFKVATTTPKLELDGRDASFESDENVIYWGPANHFKGMEAVGGKLFLSDRRLRFRSHKFNVQTHDESYALSQITSIEPARTLGIIPNAILVCLSDGRRERFVVMNRREWIERLRHATLR